jgi:hypothetical protein
LSSPWRSQVLGYIAERAIQKRSTLGDYRRLLQNAALAVEKHPVRYSRHYDLYSREEIEALILECRL